MFHVQTPIVADKHPNAGYQLEPASEPAASDRPPVLDGYPVARSERVHGGGFRDWSGWRDIDQAQVVYPEPDEQMIVNGAQFDRIPELPTLTQPLCQEFWILRERGIVNIVYTGFATNLCISIRQRA